MTHDASAALSRSILQNTSDLITVFDEGGDIVYINEACSKIFGAPPEDYIGHNILEYVHPEEAGRAAITLQLTSQFGPAPGNTHFRMRRADDTYIELEFTSSAVSDGERPLLMTLGRVAETRFALEHTLQQLLASGSLDEVMRTVCNLFSWRGLDSRVAFVWRTADGTDANVGVGDLPPELTGANAPSESPWGEALETMRGAEHSDLSQLPEDLRKVAEANGLGAYWIEPVPGAPQPGLITLWTVKGGRPPSVHVQGMTLARSIFELILRWTDQQERLDFAAFNDDLTRMPNRKAFFRALKDSEHGAVLYCDLDRFKPVNDTFGHAAGDDVLRQVAQRLRGCVRDGDTVARIGGDEFGVLCPGSTLKDADVVVRRIMTSIAKPFDLGDGRLVEVEISIGLSHTTDQLDEESVAAADRALYEMKARRRAAYLAKIGGA